MIPANNNSVGPDSGQTGAGRRPEDARPEPQPAGRRAAPSAYPSDKARGAEIILKTRARRFIFFGGPALALLLVFLLIAL
ncbi:hypothetical protein [Emcibacter sp. SYSU 3D8]|uniref:hypothetical protein n=1 Tax=Emcibacter sp. SYSU 3D8 TaxID=3133969 RepID=UPI0031FF0FFA